MSESPATRRPTGSPRRQLRAGPTRCRASTGERPVSHASPVSRPRTDPALGGLPRQARAQIPPPRGNRPPQEQLRRARKSLAGRYYQLLTGHADIGSFLHERMTEAQRVESSECWWCNCGRRQSRHHLFTEFRAWDPRSGGGGGGSARLRVGAPEGAGSQVAVGGEGYLGSAGVLGGHPGGMQDVR